MIDTSPCTYGLKNCASLPDPENQTKFDALTILDSVEFAHDQLLLDFQSIARFTR